jgi:quercetin dioxygenase-like cupin family protein
MHDAHGTDAKVGMPAAEATVLADLVGYEPGAVVSRALAQKAGGTVTLFSFDAGQGLSEHSAPFDALASVLDGAAELTIGGKKVAAKAGESVLMPANVPHALHARQRFKMLLVMVRDAVAG